MKFIINGPIRENIYTLMKRAGYYLREHQRSVKMNEVHRLQSENQEKSELSFTRPARGYPRFHLFLKVEGNNLAFNLHLDQKKPSYKGFTAHSGEHKGEIVETEAERIKKIIENNVEN